MGINAALRLRALHPDAEIVVVERGNIPAGASTRNAGFACFGSPTELLEDMEQIGETAMLELVEQRWRGLHLLRQTVGDTALDYKNYGGIEVFPETETATYQKTVEQLGYLNELLARVLPTEQTFRPSTEPLPKGVRYGLSNTLEGQLHPGRMMAALHHRATIAGIRILYGSHLDAWTEGHDEVVLHLGNCRLRTGQLLVATNGFARQLLPDLDLQPARNQVLITDPIPGLPWRGCFHLNRGYVYFRNVGNRVLLGGGRHLDPAGETTDRFGGTEPIEQYLDDLMRELVLPGQSFRIAQRWSGILGVGTTKQPILRRLSSRIAVAVRMGGMGVAIGSEIGHKLAEL